MLELLGLVYNIKCSQNFQEVTRKSDLLENKSILSGINLSK